MRELNNVSKNSSKTIGVEYMFYGFVFFIIFIKSIFSNSAEVVYNVTLVIFSVFSILRLIRQKYSIGQLFSITILSIIFLLNAYISRDFSLLVSFLFFLGMRNIDLTKVLKSALMAKVLSFLYVLISYLLDFRSGSAIVFSRSGGTVLRYGFGFGSPNTFHASFSFILFLIISIFYNKIKGIHLILMFSLNEFIYFFSQSRTGRYSVIVVLLCLLMMKSSKKIGAYFLKFTPYLSIFLFVFTISLSTIFKDSFIYSTLNSLLSGRPFYSSALLKHTPTLFGTDVMSYTYITNDGYVYEMIHDNSYSATYAIAGLVITFILLVYFYIVSKELLKRKMYDLLFLFISILIYSFMEDYLRYIYFNFLVFICGSFFYNQIFLEEEKR
jgi:hypothetical protein